MTRHFCPKDGTEDSKIADVATTFKDGRNGFKVELCTVFVATAVGRPVTISPLDARIRHGLYEDARGTIYGRGIAIAP